jgi:hypothetical protein
MSGLAITFGDDGPADASDVQWSASAAVYVYWLEIAWRRLSEAERSHADLLAAWDADDEAKEAALEEESAASMQAIVASVVAVDAFHASVREHARPSLSARLRHGIGTGHRGRSESPRR